MLLLSLNGYLTLRKPLHLSGPKTYNFSPVEAARPPSGAETSETTQAKSQAHPSESCHKSPVALSQCPQQAVCPLGEGIASHAFLEAKAPERPGWWLSFIKITTEAASMIPHAPTAQLTFSTVPPCHCSIEFHQDRASSLWTPFACPWVTKRTHTQILCKLMPSNSQSGYPLTTHSHADFCGVGPLIVTAISTVPYQVSKRLCCLETRHMQDR